MGRSRLVALAASLLVLGGCYGAYQVSPDSVQTVGGLTPNVEDKDAGLVALAPGFDIKSYKVVAVDKFPVTDPAIKDEDDRRNAAEMSTILQNELVRRLRDTGLFTRVVNLTETEFQPGAARTLRLEGVITRLGGGSQVGAAPADRGAARSGLGADRHAQVRGGRAQELGQVPRLQQQQSAAGRAGRPAHRRRRGQGPGVSEGEGARPLAVSGAPAVG